MSSLILGWLQNLKIIDRFNRFNSRERKLAVIAAVIFVVFFTDLLVVHPLLDHYAGLEEEIVTGQKKLAQNMMNITRKEMIERQYALYETMIREPATDEEETASLLSEIESLARNNKVTLIDLKPLEAKSHDFYKEFTVSLDIETEMEPLIRFLYQIETAPDLMKVMRAKLTLKGKAESMMKVQLEVSKIVIL